MAGELWSTENRGVELAPRLTERQLEQVESIHQFRVPSDLRSLLSSALPLGPHFPDWRAPGSPYLTSRLSWPARGIAFDIERNAFWFHGWGARPATLSDALAFAASALARAPRLIPIYSHRFIPGEPEDAGNPMFSVYQTDIIYYGTDLRRFSAHQFGGRDYLACTSGETRRIRLWSDLVERNSRLKES
jgi:hypothetical protein